jgi:uncharacterized membrane-anchored protein
MTQPPVTLSSFQSLLVGFAIVILVYVSQVYSSKRSSKDGHDAPKEKQLSILSQVLRSSLVWALAFIITVAILRLFNTRIDYLALAVVGIVSIASSWYEAKKLRSA